MAEAIEHLPPPAVRGYGECMSRKPALGDEAFTHNEPDVDPLGAIYSEMVTPDIAEMTEHAEQVAQAKETEPESI